MKIRKMDRKAVSPVIAIVLLLMMTVAAAGAAYFWLTSMQSSMQESSRKSIENIMEASGRRVTAQATLCKPTYPYEGLVGYWMMDDYNSTGVFDVSGNNNFGTFEGTAFGTDNITGGQVGKALEFDGTDDYVEVTNPPNLGDSGTLSLWFNLQSRKDYNSMFFSHPDSSTPNRIYLYTEDDSRSNKLGAVVVSGATRTIIPDLKKWYHTTLRWDTGTYELYVNGDLQGSETYSGSLTTNTKNWFIGAHSETGGFSNALIDEPRIYDRALSEKEIQGLYEAENHSARRRIDVTVRNIGSEEIPKATWVANLKQDGTTVETDAYNASAIDTGELATLKFYFKDFKPNTKYTIELQGTGTSTTVSC